MGYGIDQDSALMLSDEESDRLSFARVSPPSPRIVYPLHGWRVGMYFREADGRLLVATLKGWIVVEEGWVICLDKRSIGGSMIYLMKAHCLGGEMYYTG